MHSGLAECPLLPPSHDSVFRMNPQPEENMRTVTITMTKQYSATARDLWQLGDCIPVTFQERLRECFINVVHMMNVPSN